MNIQIIGAGMAGLLAGNMLRLAHDIQIHEKQSTLPNNHNAVLRFRSTKVADTLGIPFKKVTMVKDVAPTGNNIVADAMSYSWKSSGRLRSDRSILKCPEIAERYIAPPNLIWMMAARIPNSIFYNSQLGMGNNFPGEGAVISTMPMPELARLLNYPELNKLEFNYRHGSVLTATVPGCEAYCSVYVPYSSSPMLRISLTGDRLAIELTDDQIRSQNELLADAWDYLGLPDSVAPVDVAIKPQRYAKIQPIDEDERKRFMFWATDKFGIYSLGRFATWRPGLLLDDLVQDIQLIERWISKNDRYAINKHRN